MTISEPEWSEPMSAATDWKLDEGVDDDGTVEDPYQDIETYYCQLEAVLETEHYLRVVGDNGGDNVEIRIPVRQLVLNGWTPPDGYLGRIRRWEGVVPPLDWAEIGEDGKIIEPSDGDDGKSV